MEKAGAFVSPKIKLQAFPGRGTGIVCVEPIHPGEKLIDIPCSKLLNLRTIDGKGLTAHQALALYLYEHSNDPWTCSLPRDFSGFPLTWACTDQAMLPPRAKAIIDAQRVVLEQDYNACCAARDAVLNFEQYTKAWLLVNSRCLHYELDAARKNQMTMAPLIDFLNHTPDQARSAAVRRGRSFSLHAQVAANPGDEILLNYGPHDNAFLLVEYGFVCANNFWDYVDITSYVLRGLSDAAVGFLKEKKLPLEFVVHRHGPSYGVDVALAARRGVDAARRQLINGRSESVDEELRGVYAAVLVDFPAGGRPEIRALYDGYRSIIADAQRAGV